MHATHSHTPQKPKGRLNRRNKCPSATGQKRRTSREKPNPPEAVPDNPQSTSESVASKPPSPGNTDTEIPTNTCTEKPEAETGSFTQTGGLDETEEHTMPSWLFVHSSFWINLLETMKCSQCGAQGLVAKATENIGLASKVVIFCEVCDATCAQSYTSPKIKGDGQPVLFDINQKIVHEFIAVGAGHSAINRFCDAIALNPMSLNVYYNHLKELRKAADALKTEIIEESPNSTDSLNEDHDTENVHVGVTSTGSPFA